MKKVFAYVGNTAWLAQTLQVLLAILLVLVFISGAVFAVLAFRPLYYLDVDALDIPGSSGFSREKIIENYDALIDYNLPLSDGVLEFPSLAMSRYGRQHFAEVKDLFDLFKILFLILAPVSALLIAVLHFSKKRDWLLYTAISSIGLPLIVGGLVALNWKTVFVKFHELFFNNDYWIFNPRLDPVITILPDEFFMHCAIAIIALVLLCGGICAGVWFYYRHKRGRTETGATVKENEPIDN